MHLQLSAVFVGVHAAQWLCQHLHLDTHVAPSEHFKHRGGMIDQDVSSNLISQWPCGAQLWELHQQKAHLMHIMKLQAFVTLCMLPACFSACISHMQYLSVCLSVCWQWALTAAQHREPPKA